MNLATAIKINAGGDGSGCHGPNCGRPSTGTKAQQTRGKRFTEMSLKERIAYVKEHTLRGDKPKLKTSPTVAPAERIYPHSGKGSMGVGKNPLVQHEERTGEIKGPKGSGLKVERPNNISPLYKKSFDKAEVEQEKKGQAEMRDWQRQHQPQVRKETAINKGDEVKTTKVTRAFDNDKLEFKNYPAGTTLTVMNVLPKVGNNPQLLAVQYPGLQGDMVHMPTTDVRLHKTLEGIQEKPAWKIREEIGLKKSNVGPSKIVQQVETPTGARYTQLKPVTQGRPEGSGNIWKQGQPNPSEHSLKGKFSVARGARGQDLKEIFTFDLNMKSFGQGTSRASVFDADYKGKKDSGGTTVIVWRDTQNKTGRVMEFDRDQHGYIKHGSQPAQQFKNLGHMGSYLNQRYGISMKLPGASVKRRK